MGAWLRSLDFGDFALRGPQGNLGMTIIVVAVCDSPEADLRPGVSAGYGNWWCGYFKDEGRQAGVCAAGAASGFGD